MYVSSRIGFIIAFLMLISACNSNNANTKSSEKNTSKTEAELLADGDSMATTAQRNLLMQVSSAIQKGGTDYAISYCNENAMLLTDSVAQKYHTNIQRLSDKNRNPKNAIMLEEDKLAWEKINQLKTHFIQVNNKGETYYYKPIALAMPTCLKCHGTQNDIPLSTQRLIQANYPNDKATNYTLGELRGMWKIQLATAL